MAARVYNASEFKQDLYDRITTNGEVMLLMSDTAYGDIPHSVWQYNTSSTATDDFVNGVVQPTLQTGSGRWLRLYYFSTVATSGAYNDLSGKPSLAAVATSGAYNDLSGKPSLATVATSGSYSDLSGKPSLATVATSGSYTDLSNKPASLMQAYQSTSLRSGAFPVFKSGTVSGGVIAFHLTSDGTSGATALFPNGVIDESVNAFVSDAAASYQMSYAFSNGNKTLTITANKLTTANILTGILGQAAANGAVVKLQVWGY